MQATTAPYKATVQGNEMMVTETVTITLPITRTNMLPDPNFDHGIPGWAAGGGAAVVASATHVMDGANALRVTWATVGTHLNYAFCQITTTKIGSVYTLSAYVWNTAGNPAVQLALVDVPTSTWTYGSQSTTTGAWERISVTFTAASAVTDIVLINAAASTAGQQTWLDQLLVEESPSVLSYFSGDTAGATWTGVPGYSPSVLNVNPYPDVTLSVESIDVTRQLTTDMPDGTRLISGYPQASATIVLGGLVDQTDSNKTAAWLFNPHSPTSPMFRLDAVGAPITVTAGLDLTGTGPEEVPIFTGIIDNVTIDGNSGTVTLDCVDLRSRLRKSPVLPAVGAVMDVPDFQTALLDTVAPGLTAAWVVDTLLRANGFYSSTASRIGSLPCLVYASMVGSSYPQVYRKDGYPPQADTYTAGDTMTYVPGIFASQVCLTCHVAAPLLANVSISGSPSSGGWYTEFWVNIPAAPTGHVLQVYLKSYTTAGVPATLLGQTGWVLQYLSGTSWRIIAVPNQTGPFLTSGSFTLTTGWHQLGVQITFPTDTSMKSQTYVDGVLADTTTAAVTSMPTGVYAQEVDWQSTMPLEAFQVTGEVTAVPSPTPTPTAYIDASLNNLTATVDIAGRDPWVVIQEIAQAEGADAGLDEAGVFRFTNRLNIATAAVTRTITSLTSLKTMQVEQGLSTVANHITSPINVLAFSTYQVVWQASEKIGIIGRGTWSTVVDTGSPVIAVATQCAVIPTGGITAANPMSGYRASAHPDGSGGQISNLSMTVQQLGPSSIAVSIYNPNRGAVWLISPLASGYPAGSNAKPCISIGGEFITTNGSATDIGTAVSAAQLADSQWPPLAEGGAVANPRGEILLALSANQWRQDVASTQAFTDDVMADMYKPRPLWRNMSMVADPSQQLADRVTVIDPDGTLINDDAVIIGIHTVLSGTDRTQTVDLRAVATPGGWIMGQVGRSEMGVATYV